MGLIDSKRAQRLYDEVLSNRKNCRFEAIQRLLLALDFEESQPRGGSSHYTYRRRLADGRVLRITVPYHRPVKEHYVETLIEMIESTTP